MTTFDRPRSQSPSTAGRAETSANDITPATRREPNVVGDGISSDFLIETVEIIRSVPASDIERVALGLAEVRTREGRLFILGVGGSAGMRAMR